ncbi:MAG: hypothetical protein N3A58_00770 [Spirochaetes bacterium]|nr:hypothetical protein [Spirochaetota bacterium]
MNDWYEILIKSDNLIIIQYKRINRIIPFFSLFLFLFFYLILLFSKERLLIHHHLFFLIVLFLSFYLTFLVDSYVFDNLSKNLTIKNGFLFFIKKQNYSFAEIEKIIISNFLFKYKKKERLEIIINLKNGKVFKIGNFKKDNKFLKFRSTFLDLIEE